MSRRAAILALATAVAACASIAGLESGELAPKTGGTGAASGANTGGTSSGGTSSGGTSSGGTSSGGTSSGGTSSGGSAGAAGSAYEAAVLAESPMGYWRLGEQT